MILRTIIGILISIPVIITFDIFGVEFSVPEVIILSYLIVLFIELDDIKDKLKQHS